MKFYEICFSPTGGTKKTADILTNVLTDNASLIDLTDRQTDFSKISLTPEDVAVAAVPSYGGRVPAAAVKRLSAISGNGARMILVCVYGGRAYEDTLAELLDTVRKSDFRAVAAVAAVAEHSIARQFASGRPDADDMAQLTKFAEKIHEKLILGNMIEPSVPGDHPYKKYGVSSIVPKAGKNCVKCGLCAHKCPIGAIDVNDPKKTDSSICISCMRCISVCPHSARKVNAVMLTAVSTMLKKVCTERKECELYL